MTNPVDGVRAALEPLAAIARAYDNNDLDDTARRFWGPANENENNYHPSEIELYTGRGGKRLLTLEDCFRARDVLALMDREPKEAVKPLGRKTPDILAFAALGAMTSGENHAQADMRQSGKPFLGAMPAADSLGLTADKENEDLEYRLLRSMFIHGYVCYLKRGTVITDLAGNLISFTLEHSKGE